MGIESSSKVYLLFPALKFIHEEVIPLRDLSKLAIHSTFEVDEVLPRLHSISRILISLADNFIKMSHRDFSHQWLLGCAAEDCFHARIATLFQSVL